jgi:NAD-dependent dihydropyrimidine dehydrogenase PreA subunit
MDETTCMVDIARFFTDFVQQESCGRCVPCRIGTKRMLEILTRITEGEGEEADIQRLEHLARMIAETSLCGLGQTAPNPVLSTIRYFRNEYDAHVLEKRCPAGACRALIGYRILPDICTGCGACLKACPVAAISGERKQPHTIDPAICIKCGVCKDRCRFDAIVVE